MATERASSSSIRALTSPSLGAKSTLGSCHRWYNLHRASPTSPSLSGAFMGTFTVELQIPEPLRELGFSAEEIRREVPVLLVLKRFREGLISSGKAACILGLARRDFLELLAKEGIPVYNPTDEELAAELGTIQRLSRGTS